MNNKCVSTTYIQFYQLFETMISMRLEMNYNI